MSVRRPQPGQGPRFGPLEEATRAEMARHGLEEDPLAVALFIAAREADEGERKMLALERFRRLWGDMQSQLAARRALESEDPFDALIADLRGSS